MIRAVVRVIRQKIKVKRAIVKLIRQIIRVIMAIVIVNDYIET